LQSSSAHDAAARFGASPTRAETHSFRPLTAGQCAVVLAYLAAAVWYLTWRPSAFNLDAPAFSAAVYATEMLGFLISLLFLFVCWRPSRRVGGAPAPGMTVDVFVTSDDQPTAMLRRTLAAARDMDYPHETWLLDDCSRLEAKTLAQELGVRYQPRVDGVDARRYALRQSSAAFVAVFDADHVPTRGFLTRTLGFFRDDAVAFVQTPRGVCNLDPFQRETDRGTRLISHELSLLFRVIQPGRDHWNAALFYGSCAVLRRKSLDAAGGFVEETSRGDIRLSLRLHERGYKSVYVAEPLALDISPQSLARFVEERERRAHGALTTCLQEGLLFERGLTLPQRLCYLATALASVEVWRKGFFHLVPVAALVTGVMPVAALDSRFFLHLVPYLLLGRWSLKEAGRGSSRTLVGEQFDVSRFAMFLTLTRQTGTARLAGSLRALLCLNLAAIPAGMALNAWSYSFQAETVAALVLWALLNSTVAAAALFATRRSTSCGRAGSRFAIPLPARIKFPVDEPVYGIVDHISSTGFRFHGRFPEYAQFGARVSGELHLPGGALPFTGTIRSFYLGHSGRGERFAKSVGLSFDWVGSQREQAVDRILSESDLQGRIIELLECGATPVSLFERLFLQRDAQLSSRPEHWAPVLIHAEEVRGRPEVGMIAVSTPHASSRTVLTFAPIAADTRIHLSLLSRTARRPLDGAVAAPRVFDTPLAPIYAYQFVGDPRARA
jgi:cellulose synthase/poly-beta-1,6-N-acetylglucosamine synthase-like glycosyltransferase